MAKKKLIESMKAHPSRFYRLPGDVVRDRRFADAERLEILCAWAAMADADTARQVDEAIGEVKGRMSGVLSVTG